VKRKQSILVLLTLILAACGGSNPLSPSEPAFYRSPTLAAPTSSPTSSLPPTLDKPRPTPTLPCTNNLTFLSDLTIPDGTQVGTGQGLDKRWQVQNSGTCNWDSSYRMKLIAGPELSAQSEQALYPARSGTEMVIRILFTAPSEAGTYRSAWQAFDPQGEPFGEPFFIEVVVTSP
jgi:hypothetical protein